MKNLGLVYLAVLLALPAAGVRLTGGDVAPYLDFPPLTTFVAHAPFSWPVFIVLLMFVAAVCGPILLHIAAHKTMPHSPKGDHLPLPWWGGCGIILIILSWLLAWNRFAWFAAFQAYTFLPLWIGYILTVNGLTFRRTGSCLLVQQPRFYLTLFPLSGLFWWYFEYLNRFVQNWHYLGVESFTPAQYILHASLCFSTVLPAVIATEEFLASFPGLAEPLKNYRRVRIKQKKLPALFSLGLATLALAGTGIWPDLLFPMLWLAPLLIITAIQALRGERTIFAPMADGDWRLVWLPALAALTCGFFWELWNFKSLAHWEYSVPFVQRFQLFEMPLSGYAGYLPFGLVCRVIADLFRDNRKEQKYFSG